MSIAIRVLEGIFAVGAIGCVLVLVLTTIEDVRTLVGNDEESQSPDAVTATHRSKYHDLPALPSPTPR